MLLVNLLIVAVLIAYAAVGFRRGFIDQTAELIAFATAFMIALLTYKPIGNAFFSGLTGAVALADLVAFMAVWLAVELLIGFGWRRLRQRIPKDLTESPPNKLAGPVPAVLRGIALLVILLLIVAVAPLPSAMKDPILKAAMAKPLVAFGTGFEQQFNNVFGGALRETLAFKTIKTDESASTPLGFTEPNPKVCEGDEFTMIDKVNQERAKQGLGLLRPDDRLRDVARAHSRDMLVRGYFAHTNPDGLDPFDRMDRAGIEYEYAGENLAFAPNVDIAHTGLMNSPGHRANILKKEYEHIGVGCMDAGRHGKMFSQEFARF